MSRRETPRILVVEDEVGIAEGIKDNLLAEGYQAEIAFDGRAALERIHQREYDLIVLDVMLPKLDGFAVCRELRAEGIDTPILFLTARGEPDDRIEGLAAGGDDYLPKPFRLEEFLLRVRALLRRRGWRDERARVERVHFGDNEVDFRTWHARSHDGSEAPLTPKEGEILRLLVEREGEVVPREEIIEQVWGRGVYPSTRTIDNFVLRLRRRFERDPQRPRHIHTVRGIGYRFTRLAE